MLVFSLGFSAVLIFLFLFACPKRKRETCLPVGREKGPPKTNAVHVLGLALRCYCGEYALGGVNAANMTVLLGFDVVVSCSCE